VITQHLVEGRECCHMCLTPFQGSERYLLDFTTEVSAASGGVVPKQPVMFWCCEGCTARESPKCDGCGEPIWPGPQQEHMSHVFTAKPGTPDFDRSALWTLHDSCRPLVVLACCWHTYSRYGGPEEGGWNYECGDLMAAVPVPLARIDEPIWAEGATNWAVDTSAKQAADRIFETSWPDGDDDHQRSTTLELTMPEQHYPTRKPHYE